MYEDMSIQELNEDQLEQVVGGKKHSGGGSGASVSNSIAILSVNTQTNTNTNSATSSSSSTATGGTATASTGAITAAEAIRRFFFNSRSPKPNAGPYFGLWRRFCQRPSPGVFTMVWLSPSATGIVPSRWKLFSLQYFNHLLPRCFWQLLIVAWSRSNLIRVSPVNRRFAPTRAICEPRAKSYVSNSRTTRCGRM